MKEFLNIISLLIKKSKLEYDIFLLSALISGFRMNSKYKFPTYSFSEKLCAEYSTKYHTGYFSTLFYYEGEKAIEKFFEYAETEHIDIDDSVQNIDFHSRFISLINEIEKRPGQYIDISRDNTKHLRAFLEGYFAGEDLNIGAEIGTSIEEFDYKFGAYISKKYDLYEDVEWYNKLEYISLGIKSYLEIFIKCLNDFYSFKEGKIENE